MKKEIEIEIPTIPNYIKVGGVVTGIEEFSNEELRKIGYEWTEELIVKAQNKRNKPHA